MNNIIIQNLGIIDYKEALNKQEELFKEIIEEKLVCRKFYENISEGAKKPDVSLSRQTKNYLLFCEHPHVYTLGKNGTEKNLLISYDELKAKDIRFYRVSRGGDITYHGPGQLVGYPIFNLDNFGFGIKRYINLIEKVIILVLAEYNIKGKCLTSKQGIWVNEKKICSIGIYTSHRVTMHGFAFNINTDLSYFNYINPCGFNAQKITSLEKELDKKVALDEVTNKIENFFIKVFIPNIAH